MDEAVAAFDAVRRQIGGATLVDMNKTLIYDDVGIAIMQYALELCAKHFKMQAQKVNASSSVNFISTLLSTTPLSDQLDWNGSGKGFVQKPDVVFELSYTSDGTLHSLLIYYESDAGSKANPKWKSLLIQTTLLSALNGICHELANVGRTAHRITEYTIVGVEAARQTLILQNFVLDFPNAWSWSAPTYVVRERCFFEKTPTASAPTGEPPVDLLHCNFSPKHSGSRKDSKKVWRVGALDATRQYLVKNLNIQEFVLPSESQSLRCQQSGEDIDADEEENRAEWYQFLLT